MITKQISLYTWDTNNVIVYANSGEVDCRYIEVSFKDESQNNISLTDRYVTFYAEKPDGKTIFNYCTIDTIEDIATVELTSQVLSVPGVLECEFQIFDKNNVLLKVSGLKIFVSTSKDFSEAIESTSESNILTSVINESKKISQSIGNLSDLNTLEKNTVVGAINEVNQKANDSYMLCSNSIGQLNNLNTNEKGNVIGAINELNEKIISAHTLYSNSSGTQSTIILSDSAANYDYMEIYYYKDFNQMVYSKIYKPNNRSVTLHSVTYFVNTVFLRAAIVDINGTTITWRASDSGWGTMNRTDCNTTSENVFFINQIIGYK